MAVAGAKVTMYLERVIVKVKDGTDEGLARVALQIVGLAKRNIQANNQIDTGFMLNSVYPVTKKANGHGAAQSAASRLTWSRKQNRHVDHSRDMAPARSLSGGASAGVVVGAQYAIFQEARASFLYAAGQEAAAQAGGTVEGAFREYVHD